MSVSEAPPVKPVVCHEVALKVYINALLAEPQTESVEALVPQAAKVVVKEEVILPPLPALSHQKKDEIPVSQDEILGDFEALMFQVAGSLTLATPLAKLNGIQRWPNDTQLHAVPGYADWFLGVLPRHDGQIKVIDMAKLVIPENHKARTSLNAPRQFKHIVIVGDGEYGLACDELGDVVKLTQQSVRWREDRSQRPWLAGTVIEQMCALLDVDAFTQMLKR